MSDLVDWLRAQIEEDERSARAACLADRIGRPASKGHWHLQGRLIYADNGDEVISAEFADGSRADHIVQWDPARVLAEVEAKRRILDLHQRVDARADWFGRGRDNWPPEPACYGCHANFGEEYAEPDANRCPVARHLALPYADRPGYRDEWRPDAPA